MNTGAVTDDLYCRSSDATQGQQKALCIAVQKPREEDSPAQRLDADAWRHPAMIPWLDAIILFQRGNQRKAVSSSALRSSPTNAVSSTSKSHAGAASGVKRPGQKAGPTAVDSSGSNMRKVAGQHSHTRTATSRRRSPGNTWQRISNGLGLGNQIELFGSSDAASTASAPNGHTTT